MELSSLQLNILKRLSKGTQHGGGIEINNEFGRIIEIGRNVKRHVKHSMWIHRNSFVHKEGKSMHQHEEDAVNQVIKEEFIIGQDRLPMEYDGLFRGNVKRLLNGGTETKVQRIYRVWSIWRELGLDPGLKIPWRLC